MISDHNAVGLHTKNEERKVLPSPFELNHL